MIEYEAPGYALKGQKTLWFDLPLAKHLFNSRHMSDYLYAADLEKRRHPFRIRATRHVTFSEEILLPQGYRVVEAPGTGTLSGPAADFAFCLEERDGKLVTREEIVLKQRVNGECYEV